MIGLNNKLKANLRDLRKNIRNNQNKIIRKLKENHTCHICIFCGTEKDLSKEHILPQWIYDKDPNKFFITNTNGVSQTYNKSVLPCCESCNNEILGHLEYRIQKVFKNTNIGQNQYTIEKIELIILWLEIIAYKLQVMEIRRTFNKDKNSDFIPYLANFPIALLQDLTLSPAKVFSNLRKSLNKISIKSKGNRLNSIIFFKTKNTHFHFMHTANSFIYIELPKYDTALFYFLNEAFNNEKNAFEKCMEIMKKAY
ncbi:MAG: hypothetical protein PHT45_07200 [Bacteroidales bacterium]|nr:hypothetical protein [Bacteroidales bacterium]